MQTPLELHLTILEKYCQSTPSVICSRDKGSVCNNKAKAKPKF